MKTLSLTQMIPTEPASYPWAVVLLVAVLAGIVMGYLSGLLMVKSNNERTRDRLRARGLELLLHDGSFSSMTATLRDLWRETLPLLTAEIPMTVIGIVVIGIPAVWLSGWIEIHPLEQGQTTVVEAIINPATNVQDIYLNASAGLVVETAPLRFQDQTAISWRIRVLKPCPSKAWVELKTLKACTRMPVYVGDVAYPKIKTPADQDRRKLTMNIRDSNSPVERLSLTYPVAPLEIVGYPIPWLIVYLAVAWLLAWVVKRIRTEK